MTISATESSNTSARPLAGRTALVTGGGRGVGRGAAVCLARYGAKVAIVARTESELNTTAGMIEAEGGRPLVLPADLRVPDRIREVVARTQQTLGPVDILVNNAAMLKKVPFEEMDDALWRDTVDVNINAAYYCTREVYPDMARREDGAIINVSSSAGYRGSFWGTAYCTGKFGLEGFAQALAQEAKKKNILVTLAVPGVPTKPTSMTDAHYDSLEKQQQQQYADPVTMGDAFCFLGLCRDMRLAARRLDLHALSERVRRQGLALPIEEVLSYHRGSYEPGRDIL